MHILIIPSEHFVTKKAPLAGIFQYEQANALAKAGYKVGVISVGFVTPRFLFKSYPYKKNEIDNTVHIVRDYRRLLIPHRLHSFKALKERYINMFFKNFEKYINDNGNPDIVHAHNFIFAGFIAQELKSRYKIPYIITEHSTAFARGLVPDELNSALKQVCNNAGLTTCVSSPFKSILDERFTISSSVLHNIVDQVFFEKNLIKNKSENFIFINVALMDEKKNQHMLIKAFANKFKGQAVTLKVIGDGPLKTELEQLSEKLEVSNQVEFLGRLPRSSVRDELLKSHCFVLPSDYETFGVVLIEALASGLPLIATRCGGPEDIVNDKNGILVDVKNQKQLEAAMYNIFTDLTGSEFNCYTAEKLRQEAEEKFGEDAFVKKVTELYNIAIHNKY